MTATAPALPRAIGGHPGATGRRLGRHLALGPSLAAGLPADALGPRLLLGRGDRRGRGLGFDAQILWTASLMHDYRADPHPEEHDVLRGGGRRDRAPLPRAGGHGPGRRRPGGDRDHPAHGAGRGPSATGSRPCCSTARRGSTSVATATSWWTRCATGSCASSRDARSTATSWWRSGTRPRSARTARAPVCCIGTIWRAGWPGRPGPRPRTRPSADSIARNVHNGGR